VPIITPHTVPNRSSRFKDETMFKVTQFKFVPKKDAYDRVFSSDAASRAVHAGRCDELPDVVERTIDVSMGSRQQPRLRGAAQAQLRGRPEAHDHRSQCRRCSQQAAPDLAGLYLYGDGKTVGLDNDNA
jgi:hypothetical protein